MTKPTTTPPPKSLKWMGREWKPTPARSNLYTNGAWFLFVELDAILRETLAQLDHVSGNTSVSAVGKSDRSALAKLARLVRAVGRLADG